MDNNKEKQRQTIVAAYRKGRGFATYGKQRNEDLFVSSDYQDIGYPSHRGSQSTKLDDYSTWTEGQRRLCKILGLVNAVNTFGKYCGICGAIVASNAHKNLQSDYLCRTHSIEYRKWRDRQRKARERARKRNVTR